MPQLNDGDLLLYIAVGPQRAAQLWAKRAAGENIADPAVAAFGGPSVAALPDSQQASDTWLDRNWPWAAAGLGGVGLLGGAGYAYWKNERDKKKRQAELMAAQGLKLAFAKNSGGGDLWDEAQRLGNKYVVEPVKQNVVDPIAQRAGGVAGNEFKSKVEGINPFSGVSLKDNNWLTGAMWGAPIGAGIGLVGGLFNRKKKRNAFGDALTGGLLGAGAGALGGAAWDLFKDPASPPPPPPATGVDPNTRRPGTGPKDNNQMPGELGSGGRARSPFAPAPSLEERAVNTFGNWKENLLAAAKYKQQGIQNLNDSALPNIDKNLGVSQLFWDAKNPNVALELDRQRGELRGAIESGDPEKLAPATKRVAETNLDLATNAAPFARGNNKNEQSVSAALGAPFGYSRERDPTYNWEQLAPQYEPSTDARTDAFTALGGAPGARAAYPLLRREDAGQLADKITPLIPELQRAWLAAYNPELAQDQRAEIPGIGGQLGAQALFGAGAGAAVGAPVGGIIGAARQRYADRNGPKAPPGTPKADRTGDPVRRTAYNWLQGEHSPYAPQNAAGATKTKQTFGPADSATTIEETGPAAERTAQRARAQGGKGWFGRQAQRAYNVVKMPFDAQPLPPTYQPGAGPASTPEGFATHPAFNEAALARLSTSPRLPPVAPTPQNVTDLIARRPTQVPLLSPTPGGPTTVTVDPVLGRQIIGDIATGPDNVATKPLFRPTPAPLPGQSPAYRPTPNTLSRGEFRGGPKGFVRGGIGGGALGAVGAPIVMNALDRQLTAPQTLGGPKPFNPTELAKTPQDYDKLVADAARANKVSPDEAKQILEAGGVRDPLAAPPLVGAEKTLFDAIDRNPDVAYQQLKQLVDAGKLPPDTAAKVMQNLGRELRREDVSRAFPPSVFGAKPQPAPPGMFSDIVRGN